MSGKDKFHKSEELEVIMEKPQPDILSMEQSSEIKLHSKPFVVGVCGGTGSGKSLVIKHLRQNFKKQLVYVSQLDFYKNLDQQELKTADFDDPINTQWDLMIQAIQALIMGESFKIPQYNIIKQQAENRSYTLKPTDIIVIHGVLIFNNPKIVSLCDLKLFLDTDDDVRLSRRILFDVGMRNMPLEECVNRYLKFIKPSFEKYTFPYKKIADLIIPNYGGGYSDNQDNQEDEEECGFEKVDHAAIQLLVETLKKQIDQHKRRQTLKFDNNSISLQINRKVSLDMSQNRPIIRNLTNNPMTRIKDIQLDELELVNQKSAPANYRNSVL